MRDRDARFRDIVDLQSAILSFNRTARELERSYESLKKEKERIDLELQEKNRDLRSKMGELDRTVRYLDAVLESMSVGVVSSDPAGLVRTVNRSAARLLGIRPGDYLGRGWKELVDADGNPVLRLESSGATGERSVACRDGKTRIVRGEVSRIADATGATIGTIELLTDVTEVRVLEEALVQRNRMAEMGEMASVIAHQVRNPLNGIAGFGRLILERTRERDVCGVERYAAQIVRATENLESLATGLLRFTRDENGVASTVELGALMLETVREVFADGIDRVRLHVTRSGAVAVHADSLRLREAIRNILQNACHATLRGGQVRIQVFERDSQVLIRVHDSGIGMSKSTLERVFHPFFTTKETGYGLGLPIARKMLESQGGSIRIRSRPGNGCRVCIRVPVKKKESTHGAG